ncbi:MAG: hypothetical protein AB7H43_03185 [Acidimicrobiia bacterium]
MPREPIVDALELLDQAVGDLATSEPDDIRAALAAWALAVGGAVHERKGTLVLRLRHGAAEVSLRLQVQPLLSAGLPAAVIPSVDDLVAALNAGELRDEIEAAVGAEAELAV